MITNLFSLVFFVLILCSSSFLVSASDSHGEEEYNYKLEVDSKGPENWGNIKPEWKICENGKLQSPIDILKERVQIIPQFGKLQKYYKPAPAVLKNRGHDVMLQWNGDAGELEINKIHYKLIQCHWHTPAEHTLNGTKYDMELHAVHQTSKGETAVIGTLYKIGSPDPLLSQLLQHIKLIGDKDIDVGIVSTKYMKFGSSTYYRYIGSLTTPPCTEGVVWTIAKKVRTVSKEQLKALKEAVHSGFEENARPTQDVGGRRVWLYTHKNRKNTT